MSGTSPVQPIAKYKSCGYIRSTLIEDKDNRRLFIFPDSSYYIIGSSPPTKLYNRNFLYLHVISAL